MPSAAVPVVSLQPARTIRSFDWEQVELVKAAMQK